MTMYSFNAERICNPSMLPVMNMMRKLLEFAYRQRDSNPRLPLKVVSGSKFDPLVLLLIIFEENLSENVCKFSRTESLFLDILQIYWAKIPPTNYLFRCFYKIICNIYIQIILKDSFNSR